MSTYYESSRSNTFLPYFNVCKVDRRTSIRLRSIVVIVKHDLESDYLGRKAEKRQAGRSGELLSYAQSEARSTSLLSPSAGSYFSCMNLGRISCLEKMKFG